MSSFKLGYAPAGANLKRAVHNGCSSKLASFHGTRSISNLHDCESQLLLKECAVLFDEGLFFVRNKVFLEDSTYRTYSFAGSTLDACIGIDVKLIFTLMDAIHWAGFHTISSLFLDTR